MNEVLRQRLVGLAVLLLLVFLLSLLLPGTPPEEERLPATTVSLTGETLTEADAVPPPDDLLPEDPAEVPPVDSEIAISALGDDAERNAVPAPEPAPTPSPVSGLKLSPTVETAALAAIPDAQSDPATTAPAKPAPAPVKPAPIRPQPKPPEPAASAPPAPGWYVQVGSYSKPGSAKTVVSLLGKLGLRVAMTRIVGVKGQPLDRVRAGPYDSEAAARSAQATITRNGYPQARVVREPSN